MTKTIYIYDCIKNKSLFALTYDHKGTNLPLDSCQGKWHYLKTIYISENDHILIVGLLPKDIIEKLEQNGYMIHSLK
ncbi:MAG: hypothetical protein ACOYO1_06595 [Bacteroidales bacterium]